MPLDPRIDAFIAQAAPFAQPMLERIRAAVHAACPAVEETLKWHVPAYLHHGILCMTPAFKAHFALIFWHAAMRTQLRAEFTKETLLHWRKLTDLKDLPSKSVLTRLFKQAAKINATSLQPARPAAKAKEPTIPPDLQSALHKNKPAQAAFQAFPPSHRREYVRYIEEAKRPETRARRIAQSIQQIAEKKGRNWKYETK